MRRNLMRSSGALLTRFGVLALLVLTGMAADLTRAQWESLPEEKVPTERPGIAVQIDRRHLKFMGFDIHESTEDTIESVRLKLGETRDSGNENISNCACYVAADTNDETAVEFCTGPVGGFHNLSSFRIAAKQDRYFHRHLCEKSARVNGLVATESGLRIGLEKEAVRAILGKPLEENEFAWRYTYHLLVKRPFEDLMGSSKSLDCRIDQPDSCYLRIYSEILVNFLDGKVTGVSVGNGIAW
ncbi:MAG: hypothetical protein KDH09_14675 [Chrysiogenetes bacterium]|nr:hypothetical protein [Chrysiogenetes bacterium]